MQSSEEEAGSLSLWLGMIGGTLMFIVGPLISLRDYPGPCSLSCPTLPPWGVTSLFFLRVLSLCLGAGTMIVAALLAIAGSRWHLSLGGLLMALSIVYLSGRIFSLVVEVYSNAVVGLPWGILTASVGPVLALLSGLTIARRGNLREATGT